MLKLEAFLKNKRGTFMEWIIVNKVVAVGSIAVLLLIAGAMATKWNAIITSINNL